LPASASLAEAGIQNVRFPVNIPSGLAAISLALSLTAWGFASDVMEKQTAWMKPSKF